MLPILEYPQIDFKIQDAAYFLHEDICFIATKPNQKSYGESCYTELAVMFPEEVRLLGALMLSVPEGKGVASFAPHYDHAFIKLPITTNIATTEPDLLWNCALAEHPMLLAPSGSKYISRPVESSDRDTIENLYSNIEPTDGLLIRGLYTLIKSQYLLNANFAFFEEAFINAQISTEAALNIIQGHLHFEGNPKPTKRDALEYIKAKFELGGTLVNFFDLLYESWLETKHPDAIFDLGWAPSISADDYYDAYGCLISIYRHMILDEPGRSSAWL